VSIVSLVILVAAGWVVYRSGVLDSEEVKIEKQFQDDFGIALADYIFSEDVVPFFPAPANASFVWINAAGETSSIRPPGWDELVTPAAYGPIYVFMRANYANPGARTRIVFVDESLLESYAGQPPMDRAAAFVSGYLENSPDGYLVIEANGSGDCTARRYVNEHLMTELTLVVFRPSGTAPPRTSFHQSDDGRMVPTSEPPLEGLPSTECQYRAAALHFGSSGIWAVPFDAFMFEANDNLRWESVRARKMGALISMPYRLDVQPGRAALWLEEGSE